MIESLYESHTYNMWLAEIVYHVAFRYKKPHASLLSAKATRQQFSWSIGGRLQTTHMYSAVTVQGGGGLKHATCTSQVESVFMPGLNSTAAVSTNSN